MEHWYSKPEWWAIAISVAALTQSYWLSHVKGLLWPRDVRIFEAILPDINFGVAGSAIGLCGALVSRNVDSLVSHMAVVARNKVDRRECRFEALFNRMRQITGSGDEFNARFWIVLQLAADSPQAYDITFANDAVREAFKAISEEARAGWFRLVAQQVPPPFDATTPENAQRLATANQAMFTAPINAQFISDAVSRYIDGGFYWIAGDYDITLEISVDGTDRVFSKKWQISITAEMEGNLRQNALRLVASACLQPPVVVGQFYAAWPTYKPFDGGSPG